MSEHRELRCVVRLAGRVPEIVFLREGYAYESLGTAVATRPLDGFRTTLLAYDPSCGEDGPLVITGLDAEGTPRSLEPDEAVRLATQFEARPRRAKTAVELAQLPFAFAADAHDDADGDAA